MQTTQGLMIGAFPVPHVGHDMALYAARALVGQLVVGVWGAPDDAVDVQTRVGWLKDLAPWAEVVGLSAPGPLAPPGAGEAHWTTVAEVLDRALPACTHVVGGDDSVAPLAKAMGLPWLPIDPDGAFFPLRDSDVAADPMGCWDVILPVARPHLAKRVHVVGAESSGKSTLVQALAGALETVAVPEYARTLMERNGNHCDLAVIETIARGQTALEDSMARHANRILVCDTDVLSTVVWSEDLYGACPQAVRDAAAVRKPDLYLLCDLAPWEADPLRVHPDNIQRKQFFSRLKAVVESAGMPWKLLSGPPEQRLAEALKALHEHDIGG